MAKPKAKASKVKLGNKFSSKKNSRGGSNKGFEKFQSKKNLNGKSKGRQHQLKKIGSGMPNKIDYSRHHSNDDNAIETDDAEFSDDDMKTYLHNNSQNMSFLSKSLRYIYI